jgi:hypothetical protein
VRIPTPSAVIKPKGTPTGAHSAAATSVPIRARGDRCVAHLASRRRAAFQRRDRAQSL